jgi:hypothetical protein
MASSRVGYYTQDDGEDRFHYFMGDDPPLAQYVLRGKTWEPLPDPWSLMDMVMDGQPDLDGPVANPPRGVPRAPT